MAQKSTVSMMRARLGAALQRHRLRRGLTQSQLADFAHLSLKYVGEIERGEANTTLEALERLADAIGWDPMDALEGVREPISEGVRMMLMSEVTQIQERLAAMSKWLHALDPALHPQGRLAPHLPPRLTSPLAPGAPSSPAAAPEPASASAKNRPRARGRRRSRKPLDLRKSPDPRKARRPRDPD